MTRPADQAHPAPATCPRRTSTGGSELPSAAQRDASSAAAGSDRLRARRFAQLSGPSGQGRARVGRSERLEQAPATNRSSENRRSGTRREVILAVIGQQARPHRPIARGGDRASRELPVPGAARAVARRAGGQARPPRDAPPARAPRASSAGDCARDVSPVDSPSRRNWWGWANVSCRRARGRYMLAYHAYRASVAPGAE